MEICDGAVNKTKVAGNIYCSNNFIGDRIQNIAPVFIHLGALPATSHSLQVTPSHYLIS